MNDMVNARLEILVEESKRQEAQEITEKRNWWGGYRYGILAALQILNGKEDEDVLQQNG